MQRTFAIALLTVTAFWTAPQVGFASDQDLIATLESEGEFTTLLYAIKQAGLTETVRKAQGLTVFAPTNAAFKKIPKADLADVLADKQKLALLLKYHVIGQTCSASALAKKSKWSTLAPASIDVGLSGESLFVNGYRIERADIGAANGVIHAISDVLNPASVRVTDYFPLQQTGPVKYRKTLDRGLLGGKKVESLIRYPRIDAKTLTVKDSEAEFQQFMNTGRGPAMGSQSMTAQGFVQEYHPALPMFPQRQAIGSTRSFASIVHHKTGNKTTLGAVQRNVELLGNETVTTPAGTFKNCLKFKVTSYNRPDVGGQFLAKSIETIWLAKSIGEVKNVSNVTLSQYNVPFIKAKITLELEELPTSSQSGRTKTSSSDESAEKELY